MIHRAMTWSLSLMLLMSGCALFHPTPPPVKYFRNTARQLKEGNQNYARIAMSYDMLAAFNNRVYVEATYEDLVNEGDGAFNGYTLDPSQQTFSVESPPVSISKPYTDFEIRLDVYRDATKAELLHTHRDLIRFLMEE